MSMERILYELQYEMFQEIKVGFLNEIVVQMFDMLDTRIW